MKYVMLLLTALLSVNAYADSTKSYYDRFKSFVVRTIAPTPPPYFDDLKDALNRSDVPKIQRLLKDTTSLGLLMPVQKQELLKMCKHAVFTHKGSQLNWQTASGTLLCLGSLLMWNGSSNLKDEVITRGSAMKRSGGAAFQTQGEGGHKYVDKISLNATQLYNRVKLMSVVQALVGVYLVRQGLTKLPRGSYLVKELSSLVPAVNN